MTVQLSGKAVCSKTIIRQPRRRVCSNYRKMRFTKILLTVKGCFRLKTYTSWRIEFTPWQPKKRKWRLLKTSCFMNHFNVDNRPKCIRSTSLFLSLNVGNRRIFNCLALILKVARYVTPVVFRTSCLAQVTTNIAQYNTVFTLTRSTIAKSSY